MPEAEEPAERLVDDLSRLEDVISRLEVATARAEIVVRHLEWLHQRGAPRPLEAGPGGDQATAASESRRLSAVVAENTLQIVLGLAAAALAVVVVFALFYGQVAR